MGTNNRASARRIKHWYGDPSQRMVVPDWHGTCSLQAMSIPRPHHLVLTAIMACLLPGTVSAGTPSADCEVLAADAGEAAGLPPGLLVAIARVETGKGTENGVKAWPWTLNQGGIGSYHKTKADALSRLDTILAEGIRNVDLGCMQLNWRWHRDAFSDAAEMMDPVKNTRYAASFLRDLHDRHGDWSVAVAHYHSADPERGKRYAARVATVLETVGLSAKAPPPDSDRRTRLLADTDEAEPPRLIGLLVVPTGGLMQASGAGDLRHSRGIPIGELNF